SDRNSFAPTNEESPQFSNDSNPAPIPDQTAMNEQLQRDQDRLAEDMRNGASDEQLAEDRSAIDQDRQALDTVAFNGDGTVTVIPGSEGIRQRRMEGLVKTPAVGRNAGGRIFLWNRPRRRCRRTAARHLPI